MRGVLLAGLALLRLAQADAEPEPGPVPANPAKELEAGIPDYIKASYFAKSGYVFALNVVANGDVYYHMNAPSSHSWYGIGFGDSMNNVRMLIAYLGENGHNVTNSCRMSYGHSEPVYDPDCKIENIYSDIYGPFANTISPGAVMISHSVCRGCAKWKGGELDVNSIEQPFIYALGPNTTLRSNDPAADLRYHEFHGSFTMDMTMATNTTGDYGRVPAPQDPANQGQGAYWSFANAWSSLQFNTGFDSEWAPMLHGVFMCIAFLLIFPLGATLLRVARRAMYHAAAQALGMVFVLIGFACAIYVSRLYNKSKNFNSAHQIIGLVVIASLFIQAGLGLTHHFIYLRTRSPTFIGQIHRFLGISIIVLAIVNAGVGWNFAGNHYNNKGYGIAAGVMALVFAGIFAYIFRRQQRNSSRAERESFVPQDYKPEPDPEYEMHDAPFAAMGHLPAPRTPRWMESNDSLRNTSTRGTTRDGEYTDNPGKNPAHTSWQAVP